MWSVFLLWIILSCVVPVQLKAQSAINSPSGKQSASVEYCADMAESCDPAIVINDQQGHTQRISLMLGTIAPDQPCGVQALVWIGDRALGVACHVNPSLNEYVEIELATGRSVRNLTGYDFVPSPDGRQVAHVGPYPHFAPAQAQSN